MPDPETTELEIMEARQAVNSALEELMALTIGKSVICTDWLGICEYTDGEGLAMRSEWSARMTPWKAPGMATWLHRVCV
jgi:hypothetical protein